MNETEAKVSPRPRPATSTPNRNGIWKGSSPARNRARGQKRRRWRAPVGEPTGPDAAGLKAQNRLIASGGKLSDQEKFKRDEHPFDTYGRLKDHAAKGEYPKPADNFRWRFFGLFYVAPNQNSYMCRLRMPNGISRPRNSPASPSRRALRRRLCARHTAPTCKSAKSKRATQSP